jgi:hypothetical protein
MKEPRACVNRPGHGTRKVGFPMRCHCSTLYRPCASCHRLFAPRPGHDRHRGTPQRYCSRQCWTDDWPARFWEKVEKTGGCWRWTGGTNNKGYGIFCWKGKGQNRMEGAHRVSYFLAHGVWPGEKLVCHTCDNPSCVRPEHLFLGTNSENLRDMVSKGRHWTQRVQKASVP